MILDACVWWGYWWSLKQYDTAKNISWHSTSFFAQRISQSTMWRSIVLLCDDITRVKSRMVSLKTNIMWETFHKQDNKKKQTLKHLVNCTLNSKFNVQPVIGKSAKCFSQLRKPVCWNARTAGFHHCQSFPTDWWWLEFI